MSLILNIDTAVESGSICLANGHDIIDVAINENQQEHAEWLHTAIRRSLQQNNLTMHDIKAIAVSIGPGSYTGLRIGLASAKGLCFVLNIPLITVSTLKTMAHAVKDEATELICPMIDARRMEVFTALYDKELNEKKEPHALIIEENSFLPLLSSHKILFSGNGSKKLQQVLTHANAEFSSIKTNALHLAVLSHEKYLEKDFASLAYSEPLYIKEFYSGTRKD